MRRRSRNERFRDLMIFAALADMHADGWTILCRVGLDF